MNKTIKQRELKAKLFARKYVDNKLNGTKTIKETHAPKNDIVARTMATEYIAKPYVKKAIIEELENRGLDNGLILKIHKRNLIQKENLPASNTALDMIYKIKGEYAPDKKLTITAKYKDVEEVRQRTNQLLKELKDIKNG